MIDWISVTLPYSSYDRPFSGEIISTDANHRIIYRKKKRINVVGRHDACITILDMNDRLNIDGNFAKFQQGHNLFGTFDLNFLVRETLLSLIELKILKPSPSEYARWMACDYEIRRVDCNLNWRLQNEETVLGWLGQLSLNSKLNNKHPNFRDGSVYFGQASSHWSFKFYSKFEQITKSTYTLPSEILYKDELHAWSRNILRGELVLRSRKLKFLNLNTGINWSPNTARSLAYEHLKKIHISSKIKVRNLELQGLSPGLLSAITLYTEGFDLRHFYKKSTFYRIRKILMELGVDISSAYTGDAYQELDLKDFISVEALAEAPHFAKGTYLLKD